MNKQELLKSIAQSGYNIGFGAKKHFATYDLYRVFPRTISFLVLAIGIFQLTCIYKDTISNSYWNDFMAVIIIIAALLSLIIDLVGYNKNEIAKKAKDLIGLFNQLRVLYYQVKGTDSTNDIEIYLRQLKDIEEEAKNIALSDLAIGINIYTHWSFFGGSTQIDWIDEQLKFKCSDKFPFFHIESIILYLIIFILIVACFH